MLMRTRGAVSVRQLAGTITQDHSGSGAGHFRLLPFPLSRQTFLERRVGLPAEVPAQLGGVGKGVPLVAGTSGLLFDRGATSCQRLQLANNVPHGRRLTAADIV